MDLNNNLFYLNIYENNQINLKRKSTVNPKYKKKFNFRNYIIDKRMKGGSWIEIVCKQIPYIFKKKKKR